MFQTMLQPPGNEQLARSKLPNSGRGMPQSWGDAVWAPLYGAQKDLASLWIYCFLERLKSACCRDNLLSSSSLNHHQFCSPHMIRSCVNQTAPDLNVEGLTHECTRNDVSRFSLVQLFGIINTHNFLSMILTHRGCRDKANASTSRVALQGFRYQAQTKC